MPSARFELTISSLLVRCLTNLAIKAFLMHRVKISYVFEVQHVQRVFFEILPLIAVTFEGKLSGKILATF